MTLISKNSTNTLGTDLYGMSNSDNTKGPFYKKVMKSGLWAFALRASNRILNLIRLLILARFLAPNDFGLLGIALLTIATIETFTQTGFHAALIQKKEQTERYLNATWTALVIRGIFLFLIIYLISPYSAVFFNTPGAVMIIKAIGLTILFQSFHNIGVLYFQKELEFKKQYVYQMSGTVTNFSVAVVAVLLLHNVWALVYGIIAGNLVTLFISYLIHPYRPRFELDLSKVRELFGYGRWIMGTTILVFLLTQGDDILVGRLLGVTALGFYQLAYRISNTSTTEISHVISQVTFPAYSKIQDNIEKLKEAYFNVLQVTSFLSIPIGGLILVMAPDFTEIFLGEKWMPMVPALQILAIYGIGRSLSAVRGVFFQATGNPEIVTKLSLLNLSVLAILIFPLTLKWGIVGTSLSVLFGSMVSHFLGYYFLAKFYSFKIADIGKIISAPFMGTLLMIPSVLVFKEYLSEFLDTGLLSFILLTSIGVAVYLTSFYILDYLIGYRVFSLRKLLSGMLTKELNR